MPTFETGLRLNAAFYADVVRPLLGDLPHSAASLGWGSDVLGYDDARSTDHGWGLRLQVFTAEVDEAAGRIEAGLPETYRGWPVRYGWDDVPTRHWVGASTLGGWLVGQLGLDARGGLTTRDWLTLSQQHLLGVVRGAVYADADGTLAAVRAELAWYPRDVWLWLLAAQWRRLEQEEAFVGRTAEVGDELGSAVLAARQAREVMRLAFLLDRQYAPYSKWFGTAFAALPSSQMLQAPLRAAIAATDHPSREQALVTAYETIARRHNEILPECACDPTVRSFHNRPFRVLGADRFVQACLAEISDPELLALPLVGAIDQLTDSTDVLANTAVSERLRSLYG